MLTTRVLFEAATETSICKKLSLTVMAVCLNLIFVFILMCGFSVQRFRGTTAGDDPVLSNMCSINGAKFWRNFLECSICLDSQVQEALNTCIAVSSTEAAERTRCSICSEPSNWTKRMDCMNELLIQLQNASNPYLDLSPPKSFINCVNYLVSESKQSLKNGTLFLPEDEREVVSYC